MELIEGRVEKSRSLVGSRHTPKNQEARDERVDVKRPTEGGRQRRVNVRVLPHRRDSHQRCWASGSGPVPPAGSSRPTSLMRLRLSGVLLCPTLNREVQNSCRGESAADAASTPPRRGADSDGMTGHDQDTLPLPHSRSTSATRLFEESTRISDRSACNLTGGVSFRNSISTETRALPR